MGHEKNVRETFRPVLPAVRLTLAAGLAFTLITQLSQAALNWLPQVLAGTAIMPPAWIIPLGHLNLLVTFCALLLLTMAAACACLLCIGKRGIRPTAEKRNRTPEPGLPDGSRRRRQEDTPEIRG